MAKKFSEKSPIRQHHPLLEEALKFKAEKGEVSIRSLQRKFKIGYPRAARLIELIEAANEP
jgi:S-DNA-T family DNA segregation ATPase FtsK/SpoIIIE